MSFTLNSNDFRRGGVLFVDRKIMPNYDQNSPFSHDLSDLSQPLLVKHQFSSGGLLARSLAVLRGRLGGTPRTCGGNETLRRNYDSND
jgi:hypothetical protein